MRYKNWVCAILCSCSVVFPTWGAEILVEPGSGTLAAAVASAADGDTLVLGEGTFGGDVTVDRSLTIRPVNRATDAVLTGVLAVEGQGITVTLQGLKLTQSTLLKQAAAVRLLENHWLSASIDASALEPSGALIGSLVIVGNLLEWGSIKNIYSDGAYVAGNVLAWGDIYSYGSVWIVGNDITGTGGATVTWDRRYIVASGSDATVRVLANRIRCIGQSNTGGFYGISAVAAFNLVAGNIVELHECGVSHATGILVGGTGQAKVVNNLVRGKGEYCSSCEGIRVVSPGVRLSGNIVVDLHTDNFHHAINVSSQTAEVTHNLCFNTVPECAVVDGNLVADPQFVDLIDYRLTANSPAVDAGPPDYGLADLDRTRNDMGVYGGPWSIGQYDAQRDPNSLAPFAYPLFTSDSSIFNGNLEIQALGVARLR